MLPALISAMLAIWRSVVAEYPCWGNSLGAASSTDCRDFSDFVASALSPAGFSLPAPERDSGIDLRTREAPRACLLFDLTGRSRLETSKPRRVGFIFKVLSSPDQCNVKGVRQQLARVSEIVPLRHCRILGIRTGPGREPSIRNGGGGGALVHLFVFIRRLVLSS